MRQIGQDKMPLILKDADCVADTQDPNRSAENQTKASEMDYSFASDAASAQEFGNHCCGFAGVGDEKQMAVVDGH